MQWVRMFDVWCFCFKLEENVKITMTKKKKADSQSPGAQLHRAECLGVKALPRLWAPWAPGTGLACGAQLSAYELMKTGQEFPCCAVKDLVLSLLCLRLLNGVGLILGPKTYIYCVCGQKKKKMKTRQFSWVYVGVANGANTESQPTLGTELKKLVVPDANFSLAWVSQIKSMSWVTHSKKRNHLDNIKTNVRK